MPWPLRTIWPIIPCPGGTMGILKVSKSLCASAMATWEISSRYMQVQPANFGLNSPPMWVRRKQQAKTKALTIEYH